jgi:hypothetical protein
MKSHANRILHDGFVRNNRIASRNVAKSNRNQLFTKISKRPLVTIARKAFSGVGLSYHEAN